MTLPTCRSLAAGLAVIGMAACGEATSPDGAATVRLAVAASPGAVVSPSLAPRFDLEILDGQNVLEVTAVAVVLREIELELQDDDDCDDRVSGSDDDCEEFAVGPQILDLPLDGGAETALTIVDVRPGVYDELEFEIHKPDDDTPEDLDFLSQNPDFRDVSIRVEGTFNGVPFTYVTDLNEDQEIDLVPPLTVGENDLVTVTLLLDVDSWFRQADGSLVDPATANEGGPNEDLVEDNIEASIEGFEDDDGDGERD